MTSGSCFQTTPSTGNGARPRCRRSPPPSGEVMPGSASGSISSLVAEKGGSRTLVTRVSKLVMARDFWAQGFDSQSVTNAAPFSLVPWNPR